LSARLSRGARRRAVSLLGVAALVTAAFTAAGTGTAVGAPKAEKFQTPYTSGRYIVQLTGAPVARYEGGVAGIPATKPQSGQRLDASSDRVQRYSSYLDQRQASVLARVPKAKPLYTYRSAFNGFAAELTGEQAATLAKTPGVLSVTKDEARTPDTSRTPKYLGLTGRNGAWSQVGGRRDAGKGVVVGVLDTGIWPESRSFAPLPGNPAPPADWAGECESGEAFGPADCNSKLIGARYFAEGFLAADNLVEEEYLSPRDGDGHGSHTASTAAGNHGVKAVVEGTNFGRISGMAPAAFVAAYKVCWTGEEISGCFTSDIVAAIDTAVEDGVDVLNYSISGSPDTSLDPVAIGFLNAAASGVFVAASAGNSGPTASTVNHNSPWITTVAAGTHDRAGLGTVHLGDGRTFEGASVPGGVGEHPLVNSSDVGKAGAAPDEVLLCFPGTLDPAKAAGKIVTCARGAIARTDKSLAVEEAGGVGMVLYNTEPNSLNADIHHVPTVHVDEFAGEQIVEYAEQPDATASLSGRFEFGVLAPHVAEFSSRGPALAHEGDLLKPDIMAPGVDVLAAVAPPSNDGRRFDFISGTSMSSPHIAGIGALIKDAHPNWSPMMIKSALMTGARRHTNKGPKIEGTPLDYGAGETRPKRSINPGLVYDSDVLDWIGFLCGSELGAEFCEGNDIPVLDPSDMNYPTVAIGALAGKQTVHRTLTNVSGMKSTYRGVIKQPDGVHVKVRPARFTLGAGKSQDVRITFTRTDAALDEYAFGRLIWKSKKLRGGTKFPTVRYKVRTELAVKPVAVSAPEEIYGEGTSGSFTYDVTSGFEGVLNTDEAGLEAAQEFAEHETTDSSGGWDGEFVSDADTAVYTVTVPEGTTLARFATFDRDYPSGTDFDLIVASADGSFFDFSAGGTAEEQVDIVNPAPGDYLVAVDAWGIPHPLTPRLFAWILGDSAAGNMTASDPGAVSSGETVQVTVEWSGLDAGKRYIGRVDYVDGDGAVQDHTIVRVDTDT